MKKIIVLTGIILLAVSCVSKKKADGLNAEKDALAREVAVKDSLINDVFTSLNQISENLYAITTRENIVTSNASAELGKEQRLQISEDIAAIDQLLQQNRATIDRLKNSTEGLRKANVRIQELERLIDNMNNQIAKKDSDITALRDELGKMNIEVQTLTDQVNLLSADKVGLEASVAEKVDALNEVYYIVGEEKELKNANVVYKSGFLGRTVKVTDNYDLGIFTKINKKSVDEILIGHKKATIVTTHPEGSYEIVMGDNNVFESVRILDNGKFWESSRILVVTYK